MLSDCAVPLTTDHDRNANMTTEEATAAPKLSTRDRILAETAHLVAARGYHETSTRDIAQCVGIRQPSLFHHFSAKEDIFKELIRLSLEPATIRAEKYAALPGNASARLVAFLLEDLSDLLNPSFDIRGLFDEETLRAENFDQQRNDLYRYYAVVSSIVQQGIDEGLFRDVSMSHFERLFRGILLATAWRRDSEGSADPNWPLFTIEYLLRGILRSPSSYPKILRAGQRLASGS